MMDMPPVIFASPIAAIVGHGLQVEAGSQALGRNWLGNNAAVAVIEDAMPGHRRGLVPEPPDSFEIA